MSIFYSNFIKFLSKFIAKCNILYINVKAVP